MMSTRLGAVLCVASYGAILASCVVQGPAIITTAEQAIQLGRKACLDDGSKPKANWQARHRAWRDDIWQVWVAGDDNRWDPDGPHVEVWADGTVGECTERVISTG